MGKFKTSGLPYALGTDGEILCTKRQRVIEFDKGHGGHCGQRGVLLREDHLADTDRIALDVVEAEGHFQRHAEVVDLLDEFTVLFDKVVDPCYH